MMELYQRISKRAYEEQKSRQNDTGYITRLTNSFFERMQQANQYIVGILSMLLLVRFILALLNANSYHVLVESIYSLTNPFVAPFKGLFDTNVTLNTANFQIETLAAILVYILLGFIFVQVLNVVDN